jgi:hypothetical protein
MLECIPSVTLREVRRDMSGPARGVVIAVLSAAAVAVAAPPGRADDDPTVARGVQYLKARAGGSGVGETALMTVAMIKAGVPLSDPAVTGAISRLKRQFTTSSYTPERTGGQDVYEAAVVAMALANCDVEARRGFLETVTRYLVSRQKANGCWDYDHRGPGDSSISQYAVLGLWEAESSGAHVPPDVWDRAASWYISTQNPDGSWSYHPDESQGSGGTISITAAGVGSLLICRRELVAASRGIVPDLSPLLVPLTPAGPNAPYEPKVSSRTIDAAAKAGLAWLNRHFATAGQAIIGHSVYYGLYGIERIGALANRETLGQVSWFDEGQRFIQQTQQPDGSWNAEYGTEVNTAWSILFSTKATAKTLRRIEIRRLGAGTLLGGRGLPKDLTSMTVAGGRVISRPMNGAVEGMLAVLEDPRAQDASSAVAGLVARYESQGPSALRPHKDRFRDLLADRDPGLRRVAAWCLARTGDLDVVPALIASLTDADQGVVDAARQGLQLLSRKVDGFGPPSPSSPEQREEAARQWRAWFEAIRPLDLVGQEDPDDPSTGRPR